MKLHLIAVFRNKELTTHKFVKFTKEIFHYLPAIKKEILTQKNTKIITDKAYIAEKNKHNFTLVGREIHTHIKL
nr:hypothetical protein GTC16762_28970 [Pigmentibacter ruber]